LDAAVAPGLIDAANALPESERGGPLFEWVRLTAEEARLLLARDGASLGKNLASLGELIKTQFLPSESLAATAASLHDAVDFLLEIVADNDTQAALSVLVGVHSIQGHLEKIQGEDPERRLLVSDHRPRLRSAAKKLLEQDATIRELIPKDLLP
jgi:hypothetical protein